MFRKPNPSSGVPIYVQLKEQIRHAIETGALTAGEQLPGIRGLAETRVINPNTVIKVYRELENQGVLEIRHGLGAFVAARRGKSKTEGLRDAQQLVREFVEKLRKEGLDEGEIRRLFEAELAVEFQRERTAISVIEQPMEIAAHQNPIRQLMPLGRPRTA